MRIILASKSPRRKELLSMITKDFEVIVSGSEEVVNEELKPSEKVIELAKQKAEDVYKTIEGTDFAVIGSDTIVVTNEDEILGKPKDREDAIRMLTTLSNKTHKVMTGVCIIQNKNGNVTERSFCDIANVHVKEITLEEIEKWLDTGNAWDKAGAYAIQQEFAIHIDKLDGNYSTVMGFPIHIVYDELKALKIV
ncbi:MAG: septum formation protein Maf [Clostridia bacterium]|nr:septum formation protein Maf [Clostridia bacterium]